MKAVVWTGPLEMVLKNEPVPPIKRDEVLVRVDSVGICGSELSGYLGKNTLRVPPLVMGHEFAGTIAAIGSDVRGLAKADRVAVNPLITCGNCVFCMKGMESLCLHRRLIGAHQAGAFAEFVAVPEKNCLPLRASVDLLAASLAEPLACSVRAVKIGGVTNGCRVMVLGAGPIGLLVMKTVQHNGGRVALAAEINPARMALAKAWGAERVSNPRESDVFREIRELTDGLGADIVFDAVGSSTTRRLAVDSAYPGGTVVLIGLHESESVLQVNHIIRSEIRLAGAFAYTPQDFSEALGLLTDGIVRPSSDWVEERPLEDCDISFSELIDTNLSAAKIILHP